MMIHMQKRYVFGFFAHNEKHRIQIVEQFQYEINVWQIRFYKLEFNFIKWSVRTDFYLHMKKEKNQRKSAKSDVEKSVPWHTKLKPPSVENIKRVTYSTFEASEKKKMLVIPCSVAKPITGTILTVKNNPKFVIICRIL